MTLTPMHRDLVKNLLASVATHLGVETCLLYELTDASAALQLAISLGVGAQAVGRIQQLALERPGQAVAIGGNPATDRGQQAADATETVLYSLGIRAQLCRPTASHPRPPCSRRWRSIPRTTG